MVIYGFIIHSSTKIQGQIDKTPQMGDEKPISD